MSVKYISIDSQPNIQNFGDIMTCRYYHGFMYPDGIDALGDCGSDDVDGKKWDIFHIYTETENAYYGTPMLGIGLLDCMIMKSDTRPFLETELHHHVGMFSSHTKSDTGTRWNISINPIVNKF